MVMNPDVDAYISRSEKWPAELAELRPILVGSGLTEEIKWAKPCYSHEGRNILILQEMKDFLALMFFKGALLDDVEDSGLAVGPAPEVAAGNTTCTSPTPSRQRPARRESRSTPPRSSPARAFATDEFPPRMEGTNQ